MKKILALLLTAALTIGCVIPAVYAEETAAETAAGDPSAVRSDAALEAEGLLFALGGDNLFGESQSVITRAQFVTALTVLLKAEDAKPEQYFYDDVKSFSEYAGAVYAAYERGWIAKSEAFEPQREITVSEAKKILICAMGYGVIAEGKGGFPSGYDTVANQISLMDDTNVTGETLSYDNAVIMLANALRTPALKQIGYGDEQKFKETDETLLDWIYGIKEIEGIVSKTAYNSLDGDETVGKGEYLEIDGKRYQSETNRWDMLGEKVRAYVTQPKDGSVGSVYYLWEISKKRTIDLSDVTKKEGNTLYYWGESSKEKKVNLSAAAEYIYNGRKLTEGIDAAFSSKAGRVVLLDHEEDGTYDTAYINCYSYLVTSGYDGLENVLRDKNAAEYTVSLTDTASIIYDESGAELDPYDIADGNIFQMIRSKDQGFVLLVRQTRKITGTVSKIDGNKVTIDGSEYEMSDYFKAVDLQKVQPPKQGTFFINEDKVLITAQLNDSGMRYGYLVNAKTETGLSTKLLFKIFTQEGDMLEAVVRKKCTLDGVSGANNDAVYQALCEGGAVKPQLIRFAVNGDGEVVAVDTATDVLPEKPGNYPDVKNQLTKYDFGLTQILYKGSGSFASYCNINQAVVFCIPEDQTVDEDFAAQGKAAFVHDRYYAGIEIYDLSESGSAGAILYKNANPNEVKDDGAPVVISDVGRTLDEEGQECYEVNGWSNGAYISYRMDDDIAVKKNAGSGQVADSVHPLLSGGDIVRLGVDAKGKIKAITVDFDARGGVFAANSSNFNIDFNRSPMFFDGGIYTVADGYLALSRTKSGTAWDFSPANLRYVSASTNNIVRYDAESGELRPVTLDTLKTGLSDGKDAYYAVVCSNNFVTKTIVVYDRTEARQ